MGRYRHFHCCAVLLAWAGSRTLCADPALALSDASPRFDTLRYDWLQPAEEQRMADAAGTLTSTSSPELKDPFTVVSSGSLWQEQQSSISTRPLMDNLAVTSAATRTTTDGVPGAVANEVSTATTYQPVETVTVQGTVHHSNDASLDPVVSSGAGCSVETHLPLGSVVNMAVNSDQTRTDANPGLDVVTNTYEAQVQKPVGPLPLTAVLKGHYVETETSGTGATRLPSLEQSLVWKPAGDTTLQAGLRQQQYQNFPGITNELNQALFADWSQQIINDVSWHSYAEVLNSRSTIEFAAAGAGANGTAQPNTPGGAASLGSALPVSMTDEKLTFSTGPSVKLQKDVSASLEYSNTWDQTPAAGSTGQEQRVSLSLKGTF